MKFKFTVALFVTITLLVINGVQTEAEKFTVNDTDHLQQILDSAKDNDEITLEPGIYEGNIVINSSIKLIGKSGATVKGTTQGDVITVNADEVTIENLQIESGGSQNAGIHLKSNRNKIVNNRLYDVFHGIVVRDGYGNELLDN